MNENLETSNFCEDLAVDLLLFCSCPYFQFRNLLHICGCAKFAFITIHKTIRTIKHKGGLLGVRGKLFVAALCDDCLHNLTKISKPELHPIFSLEFCYVA